MLAEDSQPFETFLESGETGLTGTISVKVVDNDGGTPLGPTTANIAEVGSSGVYVWNAPAAPTLGQYTVLWSTDGSYDADTTSAEELVVVAATNPWSETIETGFTAQELLRLMAAVLLGKASGGGTPTRVFRDVNDTADRVAATVEADGDRTAVTLDPS